MDIHELTEDTANRPHVCGFVFIEIDSKTKKKVQLRCDKSFARKSDRKRHVKIHLNDKPYECDWCNKRFIQRSALTVHTRVHTGEKPHVCEVTSCQKAFADSSSLARHRRTHKPRPYRCGQNSCGKEFKRRNTLGKHHKSKHSITPQPDTWTVIPPVSVVTGGIIPAPTPMPISPTETTFSGPATPLTSFTTPSPEPRTCIETTCFDESYEEHYYDESPTAFVNPVHLVQGGVSRGAGIGPGGAVLHTPTPPAVMPGSFPTTSSPLLAIQYPQDWRSMMFDALPPPEQKTISIPPYMKEKTPLVDPNFKFPDPNAPLLPPSIPHNLPPTPTSPTYPNFPNIDSVWRPGATPDNQFLLPPRQPPREPENAVDVFFTPWVDPSSSPPMRANLQLPPALYP